MKKSNRQARTRLQSLDAAQLAQVAGGVSTAQYYKVLGQWVENAYDSGAGTLLNSFWVGAVEGATSP